MAKILTIVALIIIGLLSSPAYAQKIIKLNPKESKFFTNNLLWTLNAHCNIQGALQKKGRILVSILKNKGVVNGKNLSTGQTTSV